MMDEIRSKSSWTPSGEAAVNREVLLAETLINLGKIGLENEEIAEIDINPIKIKDDMPIAVDALVVLRDNKKPQ